MSTGTTQTGAPAATGGTGANQWLTAVLVALATFMEILDTTIANVALRYIAGGLGVSVDEASWVVTTYLVANAIILTASAFLARAIGRKAFFLICLALFTASSVLCGIAWTLQLLLCSASCRAWPAAAWCLSPRRFWWIRSRPRSAARPLRCSGLLSRWPRWSGRHWAAGCPTMCRGTGPS
jgi:MFS family permease